MNRRRIGICAVLCLVALWMTGFASSLAAGRCLDHQREAQSRVIACRLASTTTLSRLSRADDAEYVRIGFEHGIVLSELGREDEALTAMRAATARASLDQAALAPDQSAPVTLAGRVILERAGQLEIDSNAFKTFARAIDEG